MHNNNFYICPICGYDKLEEAPYNTNGGGSFDICPCCGQEFGYQVIDPNRDFERLVIQRNNWVKSDHKISHNDFFVGEFHYEEQIKNLEYIDIKNNNYQNNTKKIINKINLLVNELIIKLKEHERELLLNAFELLYEDANAKTWALEFLKRNNINDFYPLLLLNYSDCYIGIYNEKYALINNELLIHKYGNYKPKTFDSLDEFFEKIIAPDIM